MVRTAAADYWIVNVLRFENGLWPKIHPIYVFDYLFIFFEEKVILITVFYL